jgi:Tfp pilus assembly protein PilX
MSRITPGRNGWTPDAARIARAMSARARAGQAAEESRRAGEERERAESEYYEDNGCPPRPMGYFGTETDAYFYER